MLENRRKSHLHIFGAKCHKQDAKLRGSGWSGVVRDTLPHNKKCEGFQISHFLILSYALMGKGHGQGRARFERHGQGQCRGKVVGHGQGQCWDKDEGHGQGQ